MNLIVSFTRIFHVATHLKKRGVGCASIGNAFCLGWTYEEAILLSRKVMV
jgi:hypothetical protein